MEEGGCPRRGRLQGGSELLSTSRRRPPATRAGGEILEDTAFNLHYRQWCVQQRCQRHSGPQEFPHQVDDSCQKKTLFLDRLYATTCAAAQAESRCVWVCSAISRFSPGFHDFPKFLPGGPKGGGGPDGQLFPHKLPTACPNLSLGSVAAAERGSGHVRKCSPCFLAFTTASSSSKIHITPLTSFSPPPAWLHLLL